MRSGRRPSWAPATAKTPDATHFTRQPPPSTADCGMSAASALGKLFQIRPGSFGNRRRLQQLHGRADQLRQVAGLEFLLELGADVDHGLVADVDLLGDAAIGLAF